MNSYLESLAIQYLIPSSKLPYMTDMILSRKSVNQATVTPADPKEKGKIIEAAEPADRRPNLFEVHISDTEDSHSNTALSLGMQTAEPEPPPNATNFSRCFPPSRSRWRTSRQR